MLIGPMYFTLVVIFGRLAFCYLFFYDFSMLQFVKLLSLILDKVIILTFSMPSMINTSRSMASIVQRNFGYLGFADIVF